MPSAPDTAPVGSRRSSTRAPRATQKVLENEEQLAITGPPAASGSRPTPPLPRATAHRIPRTATAPHPAVGTLGTRPAAAPARRAAPAASNRGPPPPATFESSGDNVDGADGEGEDEDERTMPAREGARGAATASAARVSSSSSRPSASRPSIASRRPAGAQTASEDHLSAMNDRLLTLEKRIEDQQRLLGTATASASRALEQANLHEQRHQHSQHTIAELQKQNAQLTERLSRVVMRMKEQDVAHEQHQRQLDDLAAQLDNVNLGGSASGDEADEEDVSGARPAKRRKVTKGKAGSRATQTEGPQEKGGKARKTAAQKALAKCARAALAASRGVTEKESARDTLQAYDPDDPTSINFDCPLTHASNLTPLEAARTWARTNIDRFANLAKSDLADLDTALNTAFESLRQRWRSQGKAPEVLTARAQHDRHLAARKRKAQRRQRVFLEKIDKQAHKYQNRPWAHWLDRDVWHINEIADFFVPGAMSSEVTTVEATAPEDEGDASDAGKTKKKKFSVRPLSFRNPTMTDLFLDCDSVGQKDSPQRTLHPGSPKTSVPPDLGWEHIKLSVAAAMLRSGVPGERHLRACCCATGKRMTLEQTYPDGILEAFEAAVQTNAEIAKARLAEEGRAGGTLGEEEQEEEADGDGRGGAPDARGESGPLDSSAAGAGGAAAAGMYNETTMDGEDGGSEASFAMSDREGGGEGGGWFGAEVGGSAAPDLAIDPSLITLGADVSSGTTQVGGQWCPDDADMSEDDLYS